MGLTPEIRAELIEATREAGAALMEDMKYIREIVIQSAAGRGEVRRLSAVLRRLLVDDGGDLRAVAAPRIGRFAILAPDFTVFYEINDKKAYAAFAGGCTTVFGVEVAAAAVEEGGGPPAPTPGFHPSARKEYSLDTFLSQRVLCFRGEWVSRGQAVKYMANIASGVHSGTPTQDFKKAAELAAKIRKTLTLSIRKGMLSLQFNIGGLYLPEPKFTYRAEDLDAVLVELLATARFLTESPAIAQLESVLRSELTGDH